MKTLLSLPYTYDQIDHIIQLSADILKNKQVITFTGGLGAGKTTFIRYLLTHWGVEESAINSPTFTYVNVYKNRAAQTFYHFDLYRLQTLEEFMMAGFQEYIYNPEIQALIEWPELVMNLLTTSVAHCTLAYGAHEDERTITIQLP